MAYNQKEYMKEYRARNREKAKAYSKKYREKKKDGHFSVYYLPEENYVGMTDCMYDRMRLHKHRGKNTEGYRVLRIFEDPIQAHLYETQWHTIGTHGFVHSNRNTWTGKKN